MLGCLKDILATLIGMAKILKSIDKNTEEAVEHLKKLGRNY